jgi:hypothetical protein
MEYPVQMGSAAMVDIQSFIKIGSGIQKLLKGDYATRRKVSGSSPDEVSFFFQLT